MPYPEFPRSRPATALPRRHVLAVACSGLLLASLAFSLVGMLPDEQFYSWGWRACFVASTV